MIELPLLEAAGRLWHGAGSRQEGMIDMGLLDSVAARLAAGAIDDWPESGRDCGECQACCECLLVRDLPEKGKWDKCKHQCAAGCGIYESRPDTCRDFQCAWRAGILADPQPDNRPDRLGLIICLDSDGCPDAVHAHECWPGAQTEPRAEVVLARLARRWVVVIHRWGTSEIGLLGSSERTAAWLDQYAPEAARMLRAKMEGVA